MQIEVFTLTYESLFITTAPDLPPWYTMAYSKCNTSYDLLKHQISREKFEPPDL